MDLHESGDDREDFSPAADPSSQAAGFEPFDGDKPIQNQPFDEAIGLTDESSVTDDDSEPDFNQTGDGPSDNFGDNAMLVTNQSYDEAIDVSEATSQASPNASGISGQGGDGASSDDDRMSPPGFSDNGRGFGDESDSSDSSDEDEYVPGADTSPKPSSGEEGTFQPIEGGYNPADYADLDVAPEISDLFMYITRYQAQKIELESALKPFIPEYIPSVGDIDAFLRVPRPDGKDDEIGLKVLDEPCATQSDRTVLEMQLRAFTKQSGLAAQQVAHIEDAQNNPEAIKKWIKSIEELHQSKPAAGVTFSKPMPDIEPLMQVWPNQFEELLNEVPLPPPHLDVSVEDYCKICCGLMDIPVYQDNLIQSLHQMCVLYSEFKSNQHFNQNIQQDSMQVPNQDFTGQPGMF